jgi:predicted nucleic acid-binding protein
MVGCWTEDAATSIGARPPCGGIVVGARGARPVALLIAATAAAAQLPLYTRNPGAFEGSMASLRSSRSADPAVGQAPIKQAHR